MRNTIIYLLFVIPILMSCNKDVNYGKLISTDKQTVLSPKETELRDKVQLASKVLEKLIQNKNIREELYSFISAKYKKTGKDEELTFREIFASPKVLLPGVKSDFLIRFKQLYINAFITGVYKTEPKYEYLKFSSQEDIEKYFGIIRKPVFNTSINTTNTLISDNVFVPDGYEIYIPYSENYEGVIYNYYAVTYNPFDNLDQNEGNVYDASTGQYLYVAEIDDAYAWETPTFIVTVDDGLSIQDFENGLPVSSQYYKIDISDDNYNNLVITNQVLPSNPSPCSKRLAVRDGRWTLIHNGYGLFEGAIEFAVSITNDVSEVRMPFQNGLEYPTITIDKTSTSFGYKKISRKKVKTMINVNNDYINIGASCFPWCSGENDRMMFIYEFDKPNAFSSYSKEFSGFMSSATNFIVNPTLRAAVGSFIDSGVAPLVKVLLEGSEQSRIEHFGIIGFNEVNSNMTIPSISMSPSLLNLYRPYGSSQTMATLVIE